MTSNRVIPTFTENVKVDQPPPCERPHTPGEEYKDERLLYPLFDLFLITIDHLRGRNCCIMPT